MQSFSKKVLLMGVALLTISGASAAELSVEDFAAMPVVMQPEVSPDGSKIAVMVRNDSGYYDIMVTPFDKTDFVKVASLVKAYDRVEWIEWANNERLLVAASKPANVSRFHFRVPKLYSIDVKTGESLQLRFRDPGWTSMNAAESEAMRDDADIVSFLRDDPEHILVELWTEQDTGPAVFKVNVYENTFEKIVNNDFYVRSWYANFQGEVLMGIGINPDERRNTRIRRFWYRETPESEWKLLREHESGAEEKFVPVGHVNDEGKILVLSDYRIRREGLYRYDVHTGEYEELLFAPEHHDLDDVIKVDDRIVGVAWIADYFEQKYFDPADAKLSELVHNTFKGAEVFIASSDRARKKLVIGAVRDDTPLKYYLLDLEHKKASFWFSQYPQLENMKLPGKQVFEYEARDGMVLNGYLTLPLETAGEDKPPLVVLPHGGPQVRDNRYFDYMAQFLANRGYAVLQPNFRGSTGFGTNYEVAGYKEWGTSMQNDVLDAVAWVGKQGVADTNNACMVGFSYGGYVALEAATQTPDMFKCYVSVSGVSDLVKLVDSIDRITGTDSWWHLSLGDPSDEAETKSMREHSPINHVAKISRPILLIHGDKDTQVPYQQSQTFYEKAEKMDKDVTYMQLDDGTHYFDFGPHRLETFEAMEEFLGEHLL